MRNYFNSMKKVKFSLFFLLSVFGLCAQSPILVLEAENADSIHSPARVKSGDGFSNGKYVGGNDRGSYLFFHNVKMEKAGTYEFKTYFNCNGVRRFTVKVNNYPEVECTVNGTAKWDTPPAETAKVLIYLAAGTNTIKITPYPTTSGGPNLDKFEILETSESPLPVPQEGFPITLEAEYAHLYGDLKVKNLEGMSNGRYVVNPEKRNEPSCKNEVVQNLQKRSVQKSTSAQYKKSTEKTYFFGAFLLLCLLAISPKITNFKQ